MKEKMWRLWKTIATVFVLAVAVNYPWELAQAPLYEGMSDFSLALWHCLVASLAAGLAIALVVEWAAVHVAGQWTYAPRMLVIPIFNIGLAPIAQMLALPPLVFRAVAVSIRRGVRDGEGGGDSGEI